MANPVFRWLFSAQRESEPAALEASSCYRTPRPGVTSAGARATTPFAKTRLQKQLLRRITPAYLCHLRGLYLLQLLRLFLRALPQPSRIVRTFARIRSCPSQGRALPSSRAVVRKPLSGGGRRGGGVRREEGGGWTLPGLRRRIERSPITCRGSAWRERQVIFHWWNDIHLGSQTRAVSLSSPSRQTDVFASHGHVCLCKSVY